MRTQGINILVVAPDSPERLKHYWQQHKMGFQAVADPTLLSVLGQEINWLRLGRMPALLGMDKSGAIIYRHMGQSMKDLPDLDKAAAAVLDLR